jgi:hypothetical protein
MSNSQATRRHEPLLQFTFRQHLSCHEVLLARRDRLDQLIAKQANTGPWAPLVARLRCLERIDTLTAIGLLTEIGAAFSHPASAQAASAWCHPTDRYGERRRQGAITPTHSTNSPISVKLHPVSSGD